MQHQMQHMHLAMPAQQMQIQQLQLQQMQQMQQMQIQQIQQLQQTPTPLPTQHAQQTLQPQQPRFRGFGDYDYAVSAAAPFDARRGGFFGAPTAVKPAAAQQMTQQMTQQTQPMTQPHLTQASNSQLSVSSSQQYNFQDDES